jgi:glycosyltransferase involved in cell wall biosynthesis
MKILFITSSSINGGAQKHIREMYKSLSELGHDMYLIAPSGWLTDELEAFGNKVIQINVGPKTIPDIEKMMAQIKPDITNTFILSGGVFGVAAWKKLKYGKIFVTVNNPVIYPGISLTGRILYPRMYRWMSKYASAFLVKADKVRDEVAAVIKNKKPVISIKNGIDFSIFDKSKEYPDIRADFGIARKDIVVTNVAALDARKGQEYLIRAAMKLRKLYPIHLLLVGQGADETRLKEKVSANGADGYIHFLGRRSDINIILANSDIFVLSSLYEGLPNALMEAMAMGLPCVATDVGGVRQLIDNQNNGLVINAESDDDIRVAIEWLISNREKSKMYGLSAWEKMQEQYTQDKVAQELTSTYNGY